MEDTNKVEIGYVCKHGHFLFYDNPDEDFMCGSKRVGGIFAEIDPDVYEYMFDEAVQRSKEHFREVMMERNA